MKPTIDRARCALVTLLIGLVPAVSVAYLPQDFDQCVTYPLAEVRYGLAAGGATSSVEEALQAACVREWGAGFNLTVVRGPSTTPTASDPYPPIRGTCYHEVVSPVEGSPLCKPDFDGTCNAIDGSGTRSTSVSPEPWCDGQQFGRNVCGGGDMYWRCPADNSNNGMCGLGGGPGAGDMPSFGNPISSATAEKSQTESDFGGSVGGPDFVRLYRSRMPRAEMGQASSQDMGHNWRHTWSSRIDVEHVSSTQRSFIAGEVNYVHVYRPDGRVLTFRRSGSAWISPPSVKDRLTDRIGASGVHEGWVLTEHHSAQVETYNAVGELEQIQQRDGRKLVVSRAGDGSWTTITSDNGRTLKLNYSAGRISTVVNGAGETVQYAYDIAGNLASATYPGGKQKIYHYNEPAYTSATSQPFAMTGISDETGARYATFAYDATGRAVATEHAGGVDRFALNYSGSGGSVLTTVTDPIGTIRQYEGTSINGVVRYVGQSQPGGSGCGPAADDVSHDADGNVMSRTDFNGNTKCYAYDTTRRLETVRIEGLASGLGCPSNLSSYIPTANTAQRKISTQWDVSRSIVSRRAEPMRISTFVYNGRPDPTNGNAIASCAPAGALVDGQPIAVLCKRVDQATTDTTGAFGFSAVLTGTPRVVQWTYDAAGRVLTHNGARTDVSDVTTYAYRAADDAACATQPTTCAYRKGDLWKTTNALGQVSEVLAYDGAGRVLSVKDANGVITDMEYTPRGWLSRRLVRGTNNASETDDQVTRFEYEPYGAINKVIQPDGSFLRYHYDAAHRLTGVSDAGGDRIDYTLDAAGNRLKEETRDPNGNVKRLLARQFDALSRMRSQINAPFAAMSNLDDPGVKKTRFQYDANGNNEVVTDALDVVTDNDYDALNRLIQSIGDQGAGSINATSQFTYDARDHLRTVTDPKGLVTSYTYDGLDNLTQLQSPDTGSTVYTHDAAGNRVTQTDARGVSSTYGYDVLNRLTAVGFTNRSKNLSFVYDTAAGSCRFGEQYSVGRLSRFTDETGSTEFCYDRRGQLVRRTSVVAGETFEMAWDYDSAGRVASQTYPTGTVVAYGRDNRGRIVAIDVTPANGSATTLISDVAYLPFGPVGTITWGDQSTLARRYDQNYWIDQIESSQPEGLVLDFSEDVVGNIVSLSDTLAPTLPNDSYGYDDLYRLTTQSAAAGVTQYAYDATGNRSSVTTSSGATAYAYPSGSHRLQSVGASTRGYDANGNTTGMNGKTLSYDERNRLAVVDLGFSGAVELRYNARGERVLRAQSTFGVVTETRYVYDEGGRLLLERPSKKGASQAEIVWLDDLPVGLIDKNGEVRPIEPDHLGSPRKVIDPSRGTALWDWPILGNAFGTAAANDDPEGDGNATTLNLRFPGQQYDAATGLHYNYFRDYDPATGRYVESDPIGLRGGLSTFGYVEAQPLVSTDPEGLKVKCKRRFERDPLGKLYPVRYDCEWTPDPSPEPSPPGPSTPTLAGTICRASCAAAAGAICAAVGCGCTAGTVVSVGGLAIPCTAAVISACAASAFGATVCAEQVCPP